MADENDDSATHYSILGIEPAGAGPSPIERVMCLARVSLDELKLHYKDALYKAAANPFKLAKIQQAFKVLASDERKMYDLQLMGNAASVSRRDCNHILTA